MIFTTSRTSFLILVLVGFICYLYCSFCIYVHQIYTCFELLQSQNKERRNENSTDMSTSLSTIFNNCNSSVQFNGHYSQCGTSLPSNKWGRAGQREDGALQSQYSLWLVIWCLLCLLHNLYFFRICYSYSIDVVSYIWFS